MRRENPALEAKYPDAAFALKIVSNLFFHDRELNNIHMAAYTAILNGDNLADARFRYEREMDAYHERHKWDWAAIGTVHMNDSILITLSSLHRGQQVTVIYDGRFEQKRLRICGIVDNIDLLWKTLQVNNVVIDFSEIYEILS